MPIEFRACAGFANRVRALVSALCLAEDLQMPMRVIWNVDSHCGATFDRIFDKESLPLYVRVDGGPPSAVSSEVREAKECVFPKGVPIYIHSHQAFYAANEPRWLEKLRSLRLLPHLQKVLEERLTHFTEKPIGVHIRRTDHIRSIQNSPREAFLKEMAKYPGRLFFLSTDSKAEREWFIENYPNRIVCLCEAIDRTSIFGVLNAVLDFFMLANCERILGSFASSFSEIAAAYGGVPLDIVQKA